MDRLPRADVRPEQHRGRDGQYPGTTDSSLTSGLPGGSGLSVVANGIASAAVPFTIAGAGGGGSAHLAVADRPVGTITEGSNATLTLTVTNNGPAAANANGIEPASAFTATIDRGDGKTSQGAVRQSGSTDIAKGSRTYARNGSYTVTTTVTESDQPLHGAVHGPTDPPGAGGPPQTRPMHSHRVPPPARRDPRRCPSGARPPAPMPTPAPPSRGSTQPGSGRRESPARGELQEEGCRRPEAERARMVLITRRLRDGFEPPAGRGFTGWASARIPHVDRRKLPLC
jgi:hypothetical protein